MNFRLVDTDWDMNITHDVRPDLLLTCLRVFVRQTGAMTDRLQAQTAFHQRDLEMMSQARRREILDLGLNSLLLNTLGLIAPLVDDSVSSMMANDREEVDRLRAWMSDAAVRLLISSRVRPAPSTLAEALLRMNEEAALGVARRELPERNPWTDLIQPDAWPAGLGEPVRPRLILLADEMADIPVVPPIPPHMTFHSTPPAGAMQHAVDLGPRFRFENGELARRDDDRVPGAAAVLTNEALNDTHIALVEEAANPTQNAAVTHAHPPF